jgi:transcriptional accessory protein Tex/SPT6
MSTDNGEVTPPALSITDLKPKMELRGKVKKIELYGAFVDIGVGHDGLLHISQLSTERVKNVNDVVKEGDEVAVWVRNVDQETSALKNSAHSSTLARNAPAWFTSRNLPAVMSVPPPKWSRLATKSRSR